MPWRRIAGPELGVEAGEDDGRGAAYVYLDFLGLAAARAFGARLPKAPGAPVALGAESVRISAERFRPQQSKRLGPGLLAAEVMLPGSSVSAYLRDAWRLGHGAGLELDPEVYYVADGEALVIAGYLTDHRTAAFHTDLVLAPALLDLAAGRFSGRPYVVGRWQAAFAAERFGRDGLERLRRLKETHDPGDLLNRGVLLGMGLRGPHGRLVAAVYRPGVAVARRAWATPGLSTLARGARGVLDRLPGPASGRGVPVGGEQSRAAGAVGGPGRPPRPRHRLRQLRRVQQRLPCVRRERRAPAPDTHPSRRGLGRWRAAGAGTTRLAELCLRCGNCEEVCQAGISHLAVYGRLDEALTGEVAPDFVRQARVLNTLRSSTQYRDGFLEVRPGTYLRRSPASLPGALRFRVLRAENEAGPAATCLHCAACVPVCPTGASREFGADDARLVTTDEMSCIGCGSCVEVCPANKLNGGQTLRVVEQPAPAWLAALAAFETAPAATRPAETVP